MRALGLGIGPPADPARIAGMVFGLVVVPAIIVGLWARKRKDVVAVSLDRIVCLVSGYKCRALHFRLNEQSAASKLISIGQAPRRGDGVDAAARSACAR